MASMAEVWRLFGAAAAGSVAAKIYAPANDISCPLHVFGESRTAQRSQVGTPATLVAPHSCPLAGRAAGTKAKHCASIATPLVVVFKEAVGRYLAAALSAPSFTCTPGPPI